MHEPVDPMFSIVVRTQPSVPVLREGEHAGTEPPPAAR
jgi:hypothetical protein